MSVAFPAITPMDRQIVAPQFPNQRFTAISGATTVRNFGDQPVNMGLVLEFMLTDVTNTLLWNAYNAAKGDLISLTLPVTLTAGLDTALFNSMSSGLTWYFDGEPYRMNSVVPGRSRIGVRLVARLS